MWMYKEYNNKKSAGQTGKWSHLVHETTSCNRDGIEGKWFYTGFESSS